VAVVCRRFLLPSQKGTAKSAVTSALSCVMQCVTHTCHAVRLAGVSCLSQAASVDPSLIVGTLDSLVSTLSHTHSHITSPAVVASTAAAAFAYATALNKPVSRKDIIKQKFGLGKSKPGGVPLCR
jgi:hypothetical protein